MWVRGPDFLKDSMETWPAAPNKVTNSTEGLRRCTAWVMRFVDVVCRRPETEPGELSVKEHDRAEAILCRQAQKESFPIEYLQLANGLENIDSNSPLYQLTPRMAEDGVLRLNGRINAATSIPLYTRQPIILPAGHRLTQLIVERYHRSLHHHNDAATITHVREKFWVITLRSVLKRVKRNCQLCKIKRARPTTPLMGQLPADRLTPFVRPFTFTGLDYFGPIYVTVNRHREKRWIALFTCLTIRAVHMEIAGDLSTDSCILCIRNFVNRRGVPSRIRSDNGTNFVGADRELRSMADIFDHSQIKAELANKGVEWIFNCPSSPNAGGCWERLVQCVKRVLSYTLQQEAPKVETLRSLIIEAENIVNGRPLTHIPVAIDDEPPLTPNHFLLGDPNSTQIPSDAEEKTWCLRKQYRICHQLKNCLWKRWIREYLPELTRRSKWYKHEKPLTLGDLVLICESGQPYSQWRRGRVTKLLKAADGQVRYVEVATASGGTLKRPVSKLAVLDVKSEEPTVVHGARDVVE